MALENSDILVVQKSSSGQICKTTVANLLAGAGGGGGGGSEVIISDTPPATAGLDEGTLWWNSDSTDTSLYVLYNDPSPDAGLKWVEASPATGGDSSGGGGGGTDPGAVRLNDGGTKQVIQSAGLGLSDGTDENITLNADGTAVFGDSVSINTAVTPGSNVKLSLDNGRAIFQADDEVYGLALAYNAETSPMFLGSPSVNEFQISYPSGSAALKVGVSGIEGYVGNANLLALDIDDRGNATFAGLTTHAAGVKVTGGDGTTIDTGITKEGATLNIINSGKLSFQSYDNGAALFGETTGNIGSVDLSYAGNTVKHTVTNVYGLREELNFATGADVTDAFSFYASSQTTGGSTTNYTGFGVAQSPSAGSNFGFRSDLNSEIGKNNFGFCALGNAPNFFTGDTYIGGNISDLGDNTKINLKADGNAEFAGDITANNVTFATGTPEELNVRERITNLVSRLDAIESNEIIDDATDTSLLQLLANASARLDSIETRLAALEGGN